MKSWRVREVGGAVAVLRSSRKRNNDSSSASLSSGARFRSLSPVPALKKARVFASCLTVSDVKRAADSLAERKRIGPRGEAQVVDAEVMRVLLVDFIEKWYQQRPRISNIMNRSTKQQEGKRDLTMTPVEWLGEETGINPRKINGYSRGEYKFVGISHADLLLLAMGKQDKLATGEIIVVKNPHWSWMQYNRWLRSRGIDPDVL